MSARTKPGEVQAWLRDAIQDPGGACVIWPFYRDDDGYGRLKHPGNRRNDKAHRVAWELYYCADWPDGLLARHTCNNGHGGCVNPLHLVPGTTKENALDRDRAGRHCAPRGSQNGKAKLTEEVVVEALRRVASGEAQRAIARELGVCVAALNQAWLGKTWTHVEAPRRGGW